MPSRDRISRIFSLALPIIGGMISQNVMNLVDTAMVGRLGGAALAAVGIASFANFVAQAFITGLSSGVQAMAARRLGAGHFAEQAVPLNAGLWVAAVLGVPLSITLYVLAPTIFPYLVSDAAVVEQGVPYLQARLCATVAVGMNFSFRGYWNGVNLSRLYLRTLVLMHIGNIVISYGLIFGACGLPELGATGAGIGTALATWGGTLTYFVLAWFHARNHGFARRLPELGAVRTLLRLSLPTGIQQLFFAAGMLTLSTIVGRVGTAELAASNLLINLMLVVILPAIGFGLAASSLVGQALGRRDVADAKAWGFDVVWVAIAVTTCIALPMALVPDPVLGVFTEDRLAQQAARLPLQIFSATVFVEAVRLVLQNALLGAGDARRVMVASIGLQWGFFLPLAYWLGPVSGYGLAAIWSAQVVYCALQAVVFWGMWRRGSWMKIEV